MTSHGPTGFSCLQINKYFYFNQSKLFDLKSDLTAFSVKKLFLNKQYLFAFSSVLRQKFYNFFQSLLAPYLPS